MTFATVRDLRDRTLLGFFGDITLQGAMSVGDKPVETDRNIEVEIEFRGVTEVPGGRLTATAHISWSKLDELTGYYRTGFEFLSLSEELKPAIELLVQRYRFTLNFPE